MSVLVNRKKIEYGEAFQRSLIKLMREDFVFCNKILRYVKSSDLSSPWDWFFSVIRDHFNEYQKCPSKEDIEVAIARQGSDDQIFYYKELEAIMASDVNKDTIKSEMTGFIRMSLFVDTTYHTVELTKRGKKEEAYTLLAEKALELNRISFNEEKYVGFGDGVSVLTKMRDQGQNAIRTGIHEIDDALGGGMMPGTWTTFLGGTNSGKTMLNCTLSYFAAKQGKKVFVTIHEDELYPIKTKFLSCFSRIPMTRLIHGFYDLTEEEKIAFQEADKLLNEHVRIQFMYSSESSVENVCNTVKSVMKEWPFDLYICDYGQCLTSTRFKSHDNLRIVQEHIYSELKQLCLELNIPGTGGAQVNRSAIDKNRAGTDFLRMTDVAEAVGIIKKSSSVITINRSNSDVERNRIIYLLDKSRSGATNIAVECITDFSKCATHFEYSESEGNQRKVSIESGMSARKEEAEREKLEKSRGEASYG